MRYLIWLGATLLFLAAAVFVAVFTPPGNALLKPFVESKINEQLKLQSSLDVFSLSMSEFIVLLEISKGNTLELKGSYSLFQKSFDMSYALHFKDLGAIRPIIKRDLRGEFDTKGTVKGDMSFMKIDGSSDVAKSYMSYHVELSDFNPTSIIATVKGARLESLLYMAMKNPYASANIDMDINFRDVRAHKMDGDIKLSTKDANIDPKYMLSDFNVSMPKTSFGLALDAKLKGEKIDYAFDMSSNLFNISSSGKAVPEPLKVELMYLVDVERLEVLKPLTNADVRGAVRISGDVKGTKESMKVRAKSDLASSDTNIELLLKEYTPTSIKAKISDLDMSKLLYMVKQPHYTDGFLSIDADIGNADMDKLEGRVAATVTKGLLDSAVLSKMFSFASVMPKSTFEASSVTMLKGNMTDTKAQLKSNIADLDIKSALFNIKDGSLKSDYTLEVKDLDKLYFATGRHLKGNIVANGELSKAKDTDLTLRSTVAGGELKAKLHNDELSAVLSSAESMKLFEMLLYPQIIEAGINAKVDYNLTHGKGELHSDVINAVFAKNNTFDLIKQYTKIDMYREYFNGNVDAKINKENILASIDLVSKEASVRTKTTKLNTKTKQIDTDITLSAKKNVISGTLKGDINSPKVSVDLEKLMKSQTGRIIEKEINKLFKKLF